MQSMLGIRREDKSVWERRAALVPQDVAGLIGEHGLEFAVQPSAHRVFEDHAYDEAGAQVVEDISICPVVVGVKEIPTKLLERERTYVCFSHTIKGQSYNMGMLRRLLDLGCDLIDYEKITDDQGRRLIFFGRYAGLAGMIDSLWSLGQRLEAHDGATTAFSRLRPAHTFADLAEAKEAVSVVGRELAAGNVPKSLRPLVCGFSGYGHVSAGAQEIWDLLPSQEASPQDLLAGLPPSGDRVYKVVFREEHLVEPVGGRRFELQDYYGHPEHYKGRFDQYLDRLSVLMNCIYWEERYPRLVTRDKLADLFGGGSRPRLQVIGDVSCDVAGAVEATVRCTSSQDPVFVYDPASGKATSGFGGKGIAVLAVDNLPTELPVESSQAFSAALRPLVPGLTFADMRKPLAKAGLPPELERAVIVHRGSLTESFRYLEKYL